MVEKVSVTASLVDDYFPEPAGQSSNKPIDAAGYYVWLKKMPEVAGVVNAVVNDTIGDGYDLRGASRAVKKAKFFLDDNYFNRKLYSVLQDLVLTGDGYFGVKQISSDYAYKKVLSYNKNYSLVKSLGLSSKDLFSKLEKIDDGFFDPRELFCLKSSTMWIDYDKHGRTVKYIQKVNGGTEQVSFDANEIIHLSLNNIGNEVYGNTPINACLNDIAVLWYAKDFAGKFFENDATPDKMYILKDTSPLSEEYKVFTKSLKDFKKQENKRKSLVMTGDVDVKDVATLNKDLEFSVLIDKFTQRIMMAWNMPPSRLSDISGNYRSSKEAVDGYYKNINRLQEMVEETLNKELFSRFGDVKIILRKVYKRDESLEADIISKTVGKPVLSINEGRVYLGYEPMEGEEYDKVDVKDRLEKPGGKLPDSKEGEEVGNQYQPAEKFEKRNNVVLVDSFFEFKSIVEADNRKFNTSKVFVSEDEVNFTFVFSDNVSTYECVVGKSSVANDTVFVDEFVKPCLKGKLKQTTVNMVI